jgi:hypothetical protein
MALYDGKPDSERLGRMTGSERDEAIRVAEFERQRINSEIENILSAYAKESGNTALKGKRRRRKKKLDEWSL